MARVRTKPIHNHIRSNVVGYVALFCFAIGGTALAVTKAPKNSVVSKSIKNGAVNAADANAAELQLRVGESCPAGEAIRAVNVDGGVLCEKDDQGASGGPPSGAAGGSLAGAYPNPDLAVNSVGTSQLQDNAVTGAEVANETLGGGDVANGSLNSVDVNDNSLTSDDVLTDTLTGNDVNESTMGQVPSALLGGLGRTGAEGAICDPESGAFITCAATPVLTVPAGARALILARVQGRPEDGVDRGFGECRLGTSSIGGVPNTTVSIRMGTDEAFENATLVGVTPPLPGGTTSFGIDCNQELPNGAIEYHGASASVVLISGS